MQNLRKDNKNIKKRAFVNKKLKVFFIFFFAESEIDCGLPSTEEDFRLVFNHEYILASI